MGTTLTGTTPANTYDSLIKVTDNGPISGTAKYLSDGLGNDSVLALSTSRVGIGTTSPDTALDVNGGSKFRGSISGFGGAEILLNAGNNSQVAISTNGTGTTEMYFDQRGTATGIWRFRDTADTRMSLTSVGLGIGEDSPTTKLQVAGTTTIVGGDGLYINSSAGDVSNIFTSPSTHGLFVDFPSTYFMSFRAPTEIMRILSTGNVGIGTSNPVAKLESLDGDIKVTTQNAFAGFITSRNTIPSSQGTQIGRLQYSAYSTGTTYVDGAAIQAFSTEAWSASSTPSWLSLQTVASGSTSLVERVRIDSDGLQIQGNVIVNKDSTSANFVSKTFTTGHDVANRGGSILFGMDDATQTGMKITTSAATDPDYNKQEIEFITHEGGSSVGTRLFINSNGKVGIGTSAPTANLQVAGTSTYNSDSAKAFRVCDSTTITKGVDIGYDTALDLGFIQAGHFGSAFKHLLLQPNDNNVGIRMTNPSQPLDVTGNIRTSTGILFGSDTAAANLLDDYEEGTFTPTLAFGGTGISVYNAQKGFYTKIGNTVNFTLFIQVQQKGAGTGAVTVSLPLASVNTQDRSYSINVTGQSLSGLSGALFGYLVENSSSVQVFQTDATGGTALTDAVFNDFSTDNIIVTGTYQTA